MLLGGYYHVAKWLFGFCRMVADYYGTSGF